MPATERVHVVYDFTKSPEKISAFLAEHENLGPLLGAKIRRLSDGSDGTRNGAGSRRQLRLGRLPAFEETTTRIVPGEAIEYEITKGSPLSAHWGRMSFTPHGDGGTHFVYRIGMDAKLPGLATLVAKQLTRSITRELPRVDEKA